MDSFVTRTPTDTGSRSRGQTIKLRVDSDGKVDWESSSDGAAEALEQALHTDEDFAGAMRESLGGIQPPSAEVADATVVALANAVMLPIGVAIPVVGQRIVPQLKNIPLAVAVKAATVSKQDLEPVMDPAKRVIARWTPAEVLTYQDEVVVAEFLFKMGAAKFADCIKLALEIDKAKRAEKTAAPVNPAPVAYRQPEHTPQNGEIILDSQSQV